MQRLTELVRDRAPQDTFTRAEVACWAGGSPDRQFSLVKRALAQGEIVRIRRGLYCLAPKFSRNKVDPLVLAQRIHGPGYISLETALSYHGWIPEAVHTVTSVSLDRSRTFRTPLGHFSFTRIPQATLYEEVARVEGATGGHFFVASPLKALADSVYAHKRDWSSVRPVVESLRVDARLLADIDRGAFDRLAALYASRRVKKFLRGLGRELGR